MTKEEAVLLMDACAKSLEKVFNPDGKRVNGFALYFFPLEDVLPNIHYISNCDKETVDIALSPLFKKEPEEKRIKLLR